MKRLNWESKEQKWNLELKGLLRADIMIDKDFSPLNLRASRMS